MILAQWQTADRRLQLDGKQIAALRRTVEETGLLDTHSETRREAEKERNQKRGFEWKIKMREPV